jgi:hypothetical protein
VVKREHMSGVLVAVSTGADAVSALDDADDDDDPPPTSTVCRDDFDELFFDTGAGFDDTNKITHI